MFSMIGAVEKAGSGADTIVKGWDDARFGTPAISEKSEPNKVELTLPIISDEDSNGDSSGTSNGTSNRASIGLKELRELISDKKKVPYQVLSKVIVELCQDWTETKELADKTGLSVFHIKGKIIPRMIADGLLEPFDKESPKSPGQKYRAIKQN